MALLFFRFRQVFDSERLEIIYCDSTVTIEVQNAVIEIEVLVGGLVVFVLFTIISTIIL